MPWGDGSEVNAALDLKRPIRAGEGATVARAKAVYLRLKGNGVDVAAIIGLAVMA